MREYKIFFYHLQRRVDKKISKMLFCTLWRFFLVNCCLVTSEDRIGIIKWILEVCSGRVIRDQLYLDKAWKRRKERRQRLLPRRPTGNPQGSGCIAFQWVSREDYYAQWFGIYSRYDGFLWKKIQMQHFEALNGLVLSERTIW